MVAPADSKNTHAASHAFADLQNSAVAGTCALEAVPNASFKDSRNEW